MTHCSSFLALTEDTLEIRRATSAEAEEHSFAHGTLVLVSFDSQSIVATVGEDDLFDAAGMRFDFDC